MEFWEWVIPQVKEKYPDLLFIAEVYNPAEYQNYLFRGKFDYLYDKVGLYDTLRNVACGYDSATAITRSWQRLGGIEKRMLNFLENHDEQRIASDFFASNPQQRYSCFDRICLHEYESDDDLFRAGVWRTGYGYRGL